MNLCNAAKRLRALRLIGEDDECLDRSEESAGVLRRWGRAGKTDYATRTVRRQRCASSSPGNGLDGACEC